MKIVPEWRKAHKWVSLHCMTLAGAIQGAWLYVPQDLRASVPEGLITSITIALLVLGILGRFIKQGK